MADRLRTLARRVEADPYFLGSALADYARSEGLDEPGLAAALGCPAETVPRLALCRRPHSGEERFWEDLELIARRFQVQAGVLAEVLRRAEALAALRAAGGDGGMLAAARDREPEDREP